MAIYIKGVEMPINCFMCIFAAPVNVFCFDAVCKITRKKCAVSGRNKDCPLTEVPEPHGRLIDADDAKLQKELFTYKRDTFIDEAPFETADKELDIAPTVIEGSE